MPSESVAGFLDNAKASRVLFPEQVELLIHQPDIPQSGLDALCEYLLSRGVLTRFQSTAIREARGQELTYAGYPVIDEIGPCPGGTAYKVLHPSLRTPLVLRRIRADWLAPADTPNDYVARARAFGMIAHPNLIQLLDVGVQRDEVFAVIDQPQDGANLEILSKEVGGAMPAFLAAEYGRAIASALRAAHERGGAHGDVRPANLIVAPLTVKTGADGRLRTRPAPNATVRLAELGLVPLRPPATVDPTSLNPYLPPERLDSGTSMPRGDIYGLGAAIYFLLTGRPPFAVAESGDLAGAIRIGHPTPLAALRPDLPADFAALVVKMMEKQPERRLATIMEVEWELAKYCRPGMVPASVQATPVPMAAPASAVAVAYPVPQAYPNDAPAATAEAEDAWGAGQEMLASVHASADSAPRKRVMSRSEKGKTRMLLILGGLLHITAMALLIAWLTGAFDSAPAPDNTPDTKPQKKDDTPKKKTKRNT